MESLADPRLFAYAVRSKLVREIRPMTEHQTTESTEQSARRREAPLAHEAEHIRGAEVHQNAELISLPSLLGESSLQERANSSFRATTMQAAQRTFGNRAVQRYTRPVEGKSLPVQREGEEDEFRFSALPPELHVPMGPMALDADTSRAQVGYGN